MNKYNRNKFNAVSKSQTDSKTLDVFWDSITIKRKAKIIINTLFRTRRGCLFLSCLDKGMHVYAAHDYAFNKTIDVVIRMLDDHGWQISFGKLD